MCGERLTLTCEDYGQNKVLCLADSRLVSSMKQIPLCPSCGEPMTLLALERPPRIEKLHVFQCKACNLSYVTSSPLPLKLIHSPDAH